MLTTNKPTDRGSHKALLKKRGWSYRAAAGHLGVHWMHLYKVLKGERVSKKLLTAIEQIPEKGASND